MGLAAAALLLYAGCQCAALRNAAIPRRCHRCGASRYDRRRPLAAATDDAEADAGGVWDSRAWRLTFDVGRTVGDAEQGPPPHR